MWVEEGRVDGETGGCGERARWLTGVRVRGAGRWQRRRRDLGDRPERGRAVSGGHVVRRARRRVGHAGREAEDQGVRDQGELRDVRRLGEQRAARRAGIALLVVCGEEALTNAARASPATAGSRRPAMRTAASTSSATTPAACCIRSQVRLQPHSLTISIQSDVVP